MRTSDGKIAGVAAGIGHYLGLDPTIVRIAFIALAFAGGAGIILYGACWLAMPKGDPPPAETAPRTFDPWLAVAVAALVLGLGLLFGWHGFAPGFQVTAGLALVGGGIWLLVRDRAQDGGGPPPAAPVGPPPAAGTDRPSGGSAPTAATSFAASRAPAHPPADTARGGAITAGVVSLLAIGAALAIAGALSGWFDLSASVVTAVALVVVGVGLVLASVVGRAPWLLVAGFLLTVVLLVSAAVEPLVGDGVGERAVRPASAAALAPEIRYGIGKLTVDLSDVAVGARVPLDVRLGMGELVIVLPAGANAVVSAHVRAGEIELPDGRNPNGWNADARYVSSAGGPGAGMVVIDAELQFGDLVVRHA